MIFFQFQAVAGLAADGRQIVARAKSEATNYERFCLVLLAAFEDCPLISSVCVCVVVFGGVSWSLQCSIYSRNVEKTHQETRQITGEIRCCWGI